MDLTKSHRGVGLFSFANPGMRHHILGDHIVDQALSFLERLDQTKDTLICHLKGAYQMD